MSLPELEVSVNKLRDCIGTLTRQQVRLEEGNASLERRLRELEGRVSGRPAAPEASKSAAARDADKVQIEEAAPLWSLECRPREPEGGQLEAAPGTPPCLVVPVGDREASPAHAADDGAGRGEAGEDLLVEYSLGGTVWDAALFTGLPDLGKPSSVLLFIAMLLNALRGLAACLQAVWALPRGSSTQLRDGRFGSLWRWRCMFFFFACAVRAGIAVTLLYAGVSWMSSTTSITDLILNAAALGFVMDLDECLFETIVPAGVHVFVQRLEPLAYKRSRWCLESLLPWAGMLGTVLMSWVLLVQPNVGDMLAVKRTLCDGNRDFTVLLNPAGYAVSRPATPFDSQSLLGLRGQATAELIDAAKSFDQQFSVYTNVKTYFQQFSGDSIQRMAVEAKECKDLAGAGDDFTTANFPHLFTAIRNGLGLHADKTLHELPFRCADYFDFCEESDLLRNKCPVTCGCDDPLSGLLFSTPTKGCPQVCQAVKRQRLENAPCADEDVRSSRGWARYIHTFGNLTRAIFDGDALRRWDSLFEAKLVEGCSNTQRTIVGNWSFCDDTIEFFSSNGMSSISAFCPTRCCTGSHSPTDCPPACR